jgi:uncharacterized membrane-anchored protein
MSQASVFSRPIAVKVPQVIAVFWIIKLLSTSVGESFADYLSETLNFGLVKTTYVMTVVMIAALALHISLRKYQTVLFWVCVALVSITGTLLTDNLTDGYDVPLTKSSLVFAALLVLVFALWYAKERTLEMKSINTRERELFYWSAILVTFALGTALGDLVSEEIGLGYAKTAWLVAGLLAVIVALWRTGVISGVVAFWPSYILTRPLGASLGDFLTQSPKHGGLGLGTTHVSQVFFALMVVLVGYLVVTKADQAKETKLPNHE